MRARSSIFYTITFIFILAAASISMAFLWLMEYDKENYARELNAKYSIVSRITLYKMSKLIDLTEYTQQMKNFNMPEITDKSQKENIISQAMVLEEISADIGSSAILLYQKHHFLKITHKDTVILLRDVDYQPYRYDIFKLIFFIVAITILITYIFIIRKIKPLRRLKRQIDRFAKGDLDIQDVSTGSDEISEVAQAFYDAVTQINKLNESRQLFLRNIMHELKTPITKGRIAAEMIEKGKNQERLISVFEKLENLINEFAAVERATSGIALNNMANCSIDDVINEALDIAMLERDNLKIQNPSKVNVCVDFKLFSIAIKNMIDNGFKYSTDKSIEIIVAPNSIEFITQGKELEKGLKFYTEPFSKGKNAKQSFGLGLYIVKNILKAHKLDISYRHQNGKNIFGFDNFANIVVV